MLSAILFSALALDEAYLATRDENIARRGVLDNKLGVEGQAIPEHRFDKN